MLPDPEPHDHSDPEPIEPLVDGPLRWSLLPEGASRGPGGRLQINGVDVLDLAREWGTPVFVYDEAQLRRRCREAVEAWGVGVAYASKAFLCKAMARLAYEEGMAIDVSTGGEMHVALSAGVPAGSLVLHGNNKSELELERALSARVGRIVVDSFDELDRLEKLVSRADPPPKVMVRITPGIEAHTHEYVRTGQDDSKFGFGLASGDAARVVERLRQGSYPLELVGIHAHIGSQVFATESFEKAVAALAEFFRPLGLGELCIGGGLGVAYVEGEEAPSISEWATSVKAAAVAAGIDPGVRLTAEPGRAIVASAAITCYTVGTIKEIPGVRTYLSVDGGMSDNPRPVLYGSGYEIFSVERVDAPRGMAITVVGKHCESGDVIVRDGHLRTGTEIGEVVATPVTGAYGYSMASTYNKVPRPPVVFVSDGAARLVVRRETLEDLVALDV